MISLLTFPYKILQNPYGFFKNFTSRRRNPNMLSSSLTLKRNYNNIQSHETKLRLVFNVSRADVFFELLVQFDHQCSEQLDAQLMHLKVRELQFRELSRYEVSKGLQ